LIASAREQAALHAAAVADLQDQRVEEHDGVDPADLHTVDLSQMCFDVPGRKTLE
jgi:hypothetical protein